MSSRAKSLSTKNASHGKYKVRGFARRGWGSDWEGMNVRQAIKRENLQLLEDALYGEYDELKSAEAFLYEHNEWETWYET